jgi:hypothetical protein
MKDMHLLTHDELEACLRNSQDDKASDSSDSEYGICPVTELLELCERIKKHTPSSMASFKQSIDSILDANIRCGKLLATIISLDQQCLVEALFEKDDQSRVNGLWPPGSDGSFRCMHSVRRLLLRPTKITWWDLQVYETAEQIYVLEDRGDNSA